MIYLHKILPLLVSPLFFIMVIVCWGAITRSRKISFLGMAILFICSLPILSSQLVAYLEKDFKLDSTTNFGKADAIVVLSGMVRTIQSKNGLAYEWSDASDRIFAGIELFKVKKAPVLILTRGKMPWSEGKPEGEYLKQKALLAGIPKKDILLTPIVANTDQEAKAIRKLLIKDESSIILVTSAFHMPRAKKVFEAVGIKVLPFPVDFQTNVEKITLLKFIPTASGLSNTSFFVREMIGKIYYNLKY